MITLCKIEHRNEQRIRLDFPFDTGIKELVKKVPGCMWSQTKKCFHAPYKREVLNKLQELFGEKLVFEKNQTFNSQPGTAGEAFSATHPRKLADAPIAGQQKTGVKAEIEPPQASGKPAIWFTPVLIGKIERIAFTGDVSYQIGTELLKKLPGAKWEAESRYWHIPLTREAFDHAFALLGQHTEVEAECSLLKAYLNRRKLLEKSAVVPLSAETLAQQTFRFSGISENNLEALQTFTTHLMAKAYSPSTQKTYRNEFVQFLKWLKEKPVQEITPRQLMGYMAQVLEVEQLTENTAHSRLNALKFYYEELLKRERFFYDIPRPKKQIILPKLLNEDELARLFNALGNKKHKAMLFTVYSAGLRVSEVAALKLADIDSKRMQIFIEDAKGKKDRYVNLSPLLLDILRKYATTYLPRPKVYLFESEQTQTAYPTRTIQAIFSHAKQMAGIRKEVGVHSLRHSFATHLLDKGVDIRYIKDLLGHFNIKTTERYLHVSKKQLVNIESPFDDLYKSGQIEW